VRLLLVLLFAVLSVPAAAGDVVEEIAAKVNGEVITKSDLERARQNLRQELLQQHGGATAQFREAYERREKELLKDLIDQSLLNQRGRDLGMSVETELIKRLDRIRQQAGLKTLDELERAVTAQGGSYEDFKANIRNGMLTQQVIGREVGSHVQIPADRIKAHYDENREKFERSEQVHIRLILLLTEGKDGAELQGVETKAQEVLEKVKAGQNFADLATEFSDGETAKTAGGDIGWFKRGQMASELEQVAFGLKRGQTSELIRTRYGLAILKVEEKHEEGVPALPVVEQEIQEILYMREIQPRVQKYLEKLRQEAYIEVKPGYTDTGPSSNVNYARLIPRELSEDELLAPLEKKRRRWYWPF